MAETDKKNAKLSKPKAAKKAAPKKAKLEARPKAKAKVRAAKTSKATIDNFNFMENIMSVKPMNFDKLSTEATENGKEFYDALQKSMMIWTKGVEQLNKEAMSLAQDIAEKNQQAFQELVSCKDITELTNVQNKLAQTHFDALTGSATKLSEIGIKVATDSFEPINDQVNKAVKKAGDSLAA